MNKKARKMQTTLDDSFFLLSPRKLSLRSYLAQANLDHFGSASELWLIKESSHQLSYLTHNFFRFFGKFPPPVAERFIKELHDPALGPVLDPMMGSGTTLVEALRLGRASIGIDINPIFRIVAKAKTTFIERPDVLKVLDRLRMFRSSDESLWKDFVPKDRNLDHWFFCETQHQLAKLRYYIEIQSQEEKVDESIITLLKAAYASLIRQASRASRGMGRMFFDPAITPPDPFSLFERKINEMTARISQLKNLSPKPIVPDQGSAKNTGLRSNSAGLVICHPPYFNLYRYSSIYRYELLWLGYDPKEIRKYEVKEGFKMGKTEKVEFYVKDMLDVLSELHRVLASRCYCVLMIGDAIIKNERVCTTSILLNSLKHGDFRVEKIIVRVPKYTEASYAASQRRSKSKVGVKLPDHLVLLRKM
jgi:hypothetical protein